MLKNRAVRYSLIAISIWLVVGLLIIFEYDMMIKFILLLVYLLSHNNLMPYFIVFALVAGVFWGNVCYFKSNRNSNLSNISFEDNDYEDSEDPPYGKMENKVDSRFRADDLPLDTLARQRFKREKDETDIEQDENGQSKKEVITSGEYVIANVVVSKGQIEVVLKQTKENTELTEDDIYKDIQDE